MLSLGQRWGKRVHFPTQAKNGLNGPPVRTLASFGRKLGQRGESILFRISHKKAEESIGQQADFRGWLQFGRDLSNVT